MESRDKADFLAHFEDARAEQIEQQKLSLERDKIVLERNKIALERDKLAVSVLIEDFKARWQELLNFENENNRWSTLYVTALMLVISWKINNSSYKSLEELFSQGENSYFIVSLALINAIYTLSMALYLWRLKDTRYNRLRCISIQKSARRFLSLPASLLIAGRDGVGRSFNQTKEKASLSIYE
jgi:hypothetical protein